MGIDESLAVAVSAASLEWSDHATRPIDLVAALSGASALAADILRARSSDTSALRRATLLLARDSMKVGKKHRLYLSPTQSVAFSAAAMMEVLNPSCRTCHGASVVVADQLKIACPTCSGAGVHRYGDVERAKNCGVDPARWSQWQRRYELVLALARAEDNAAAAARFKLG